MDAILRSATPLGEARPAAEVAVLSGVHLHYRNGAGGAQEGNHALHDINLKVAAGEMLAICGPSGHGKTSLLNVIGMLENATEGSVVITSLLVSKLSEQARADLRSEVIGYVFQSFSLIPVLTAHENVMLPLLLRGRACKAGLAAAQARATHLLGRLGLATQASHYPARLDASQSQRVAIARALIGQPRLVVADEPTSRLNGVGLRLVMDLFAACQREDGTAFVISTRDQRQLSRVTRTLQLQEGRLLSPPADSTRKPMRAQI